ncbi:MAG: hypothetical protein OWU32_11420 [Firmicutes bacterium]|nr:hypothetical protein [Bacillota bacterium]
MRTPKCKPMRPVPWPAAAALLTALSVFAPVVGASAATKTDAGTITLQQAEAIARSVTYIPPGFTLNSTNFNEDQSGQPAEYSLSYMQTTSQAQYQFNSYLNVSIDATTGMVLNYNRQTQSGSFHFPAAVSPTQAKALAWAWVKRLYGQDASQVADVSQQANASNLAQPIAYSYSFERMVHGVPAPFDGFSITISANGHLLQSNVNWTTLSFPSAKPAVSKTEAESIYQRSLHFTLLYGQDYNGISAPTSILAYAQPSIAYPTDWNTPFSQGSSITAPVIDGATGQVIDSDGLANPMPAGSPTSVLVKGGPSTFPGTVHVNWTKAQALNYAKRIVNLPPSDRLSQQSFDVQPPSSDTVWNFTWVRPHNLQIDVSVDATRGVVTNLSEYPMLFKKLVGVRAQGKITTAQSLAVAEAFAKSVFPDDTGAMSISLSPFQKFPNGVERNYSLSFLYHGIPVQAAGGMISVDGDTGHVDSFNWQPVAGLKTLPLPSRAVPVSQVVANWMKAEPLTLQYLLTSPQNDYQASRAGAKLPPMRIVLAYAPTGYYGNGMVVNALTGSLQGPGQPSVPYTGPIRDLAGATNAADLSLLASDELLPVSAAGDIDPERVMTRGQLITLVVNALGLNSSLSLPDDDVEALGKALSGIPPASPDYAALIAAYTRGWLPLGQAIAANEPATRGYAAQLLARALGFGPALLAPQSFHLAAADAAAIPASQYAGDALAVALGMITLQNGRFNGDAGLTVDQAGRAIVQMANAYAVGAQNDQQPQGGMGAG